MPAHAPIDVEVLLRHSRWLAPLARALVAREGEVDDVVRQTGAHALARSPASATTDEALARAELRRVVVAAVLAVAEPYRSALILRFFEEQGIAAIARLTKALEETVLTRVRRGIALVKEALLSTTRGEDRRSAAARARLFMRLSELAGEGASGNAGAMRWWRALKWWAIATGVVAVGVVAVGVVALVVGWVARPTSDRAPTSAAVPSAGVEPTLVPASSASLAEVPIASRVPTPPESPAPAEIQVSKIASGLPTTGIVRGSLSDGHGHPVAGAPVWISTAEYRSEVPLLAKSELAADGDAPEWARRPHATTGSDGRYELTGVSPFRTWRVAAFVEGRGCALASRAVDFEDDRAPLEIPLELVPVVVLRGTVKDPSGRPIPDAMVYVEIVGSRGDGGRYFETSAATDSTGAGHWSAAPLAGRNFLVSATADGFKTPCGRLEVAARLEPGEIAVDLVLEESGEVVAQGPVVDESGTAFDLRTRFPAFKTMNGVAHCPDRPLALYVRPETATPRSGVLDVGGPFDPSEHDDAERLGTIDVGASRYRVALPPDFRGELLAVAGSRVVGKASIDDPNAPPPLVLDSSLVAPVPTATVALTLVDAATREVVDDPEAEVGVEFADLPGWLELSVPRWVEASRVRAREFVVPLGGVTITANYHGRCASAPRIELDSPGERREVTLELVRADAGIRGRILAVDGTPADGSRVSLYRLSGSQVVQAPGSTDTNDQGFFEYEGLEAATYFVVVREAVVATVEASCPPTEVELHCVPRWPITLRLTDERRGIDQCHERFEIVDANGIPEWSDALNIEDDGVPAVATLLVPGIHRLIARTDGRFVTSVPFETSIAGSNKLELDLAR